MLDEVFIESVIVGQPVREFDVDRRIACLHQFQVHQQTTGAAIAVDEGMDALKLDMKTSQFCSLYPKFDS